MLVQIYEVRTPVEAAALARLGVDHVGVLVGEGAFPRELPTHQARAIFTATPLGTKRVALSLSADSEEVARVIEQTRPDIIHVGAAVERFSVAETRALKAEFSRVPIMRAIPILDESSLGWARAYQGVADFLLLDSHNPGDPQIGALGRTHDWSLSRRIVDEVNVPAILAGGLDADNVAAAIAAVRPAGVDSKTKTDPPAWARTLRKFDGSSPQRRSPGEGRGSDFDSAIILDDTQHLHPALQPRRAAGKSVAFPLRKKLWIIDDRLAAVRWVGQRKSRRR